MNVLDSKHSRKLFWAAIILHFGFFSFNAFATSTIAALVGAKWETLTAQEHLLIVVSILANWTGLVLVYLGKSISRLAAGKSPIETGDTTHLTKP
jgi:uncharacterized membrane protein